VYHVEAVDEWKVGYRYSANDVVADIVYNLFSLLVYAEIVFVFGVELIIGSEINLVQLSYRYSIRKYVRWYRQACQSFNEASILN